MWYFALVPSYLVWHYTVALHDFKRVFANFLWFVFNLFSIDILLDTIIAPWKRLSKDEGTSHPTFFSDLMVNTLMRVVGFAIRFITIILGTISLITVAAILVAGFFVWLILPLLLPIIFLYGLSYFL